MFHAIKIQLILRLAAHQHFVTLYRLYFASFSRKWNSIVFSSGTTIYLMEVTSNQNKVRNYWCKYGDKNFRQNFGLPQQIVHGICNILIVALSENEELRLKLSLLYYTGAGFHENTDSICVLVA